jgi:D-xylose transport system ATP-binding protein
MSTNGAVLTLKAIGTSFGAVQAVDGVDFNIHPGEAVALVGAGGAGKSTLIKIVAGSHGADSGQILIDGHPVTIARPNDAVELGIATVHRDLALCDNLDGVENLFLGREEIGDGVPQVLRSLDETDVEQRSRELIRTLAVTITDVRAEVGTSSGRQRRQVSIARSLLGDPRVVILDEPTAARGVRQTAKVLGLIKQLHDQGRGVVVVSHNLANVLAVADRIFVLRLGRSAGDFDAREVSPATVVAARPRLTERQGVRQGGHPGANRATSGRSLRATDPPEEVMKWLPSSGQST